MKKLMTICLLAFVFLCPTISFAQSTGDFQSHQSGIWSDVSTWERYNGSIWINPAPTHPTITDGVITILSGHTVAVDSPFTIDQLVVATGGTLTTTGGQAFTIGGMSNTINGSFIITSGTSITAATINVNNGSISVPNGSIYPSQVIFDGTSSLSFPSTSVFHPTTMLINSGTTSLSSSDLTGTMPGEVDVANNAGGDPAATLSIASGDNFTFNGDIKVRPTGIINGPGTITYSGSGGMLGFINNGTVNADVKFQSSSFSPTFMATEGTPSWQNVEINNPNGVILNLLYGGNPTIHGTLKFTNGKFTFGDYTLTLVGSISGGSSSSYIVTNGAGFLVRNVPGTSTDVVFPVGTATTYNPLTLNNSGTADNYSVRVVNSTANVVDANGVVSDQWTINEAVNGGSNVTLTAQWNVGEEGSSFGASRSSAKIGRYSGSGNAWTLLGTIVSGSGPYTAQTTSLTGTDIFSNSVYGVGLSGSLPVEMTSFIAASNSNDALLQWKTATEVNNYGFEVERRAVTTQEWTKIGFVAGAGSSASPKEYSYTDQKITSGVYVYRLKQIDNDGAFKYSATAQLTINAAPKTFQLMSNYPNPFNPETKIQYSLPVDATVHLAVYDILGRQVAELVNEVQSAGNYEKTFRGSILSSGVYFYRIDVQVEGKNIFSQVKKMVLMK